MKSLSEDGEVRSHLSCLKGKDSYVSKNNTMSTETKQFIQKICYRKTASIDMTKYGFINDSKIGPMNYIMKPLKAKLEKICVIPARAKNRKPSPSKVHAVASPNEGKPSCTPKSALYYPGTRSSRTPLRRVRIQNDPNPGPVPKQKKVRLISPRKTKNMK